MNTLEPQNDSVWKSLMEIADRDLAFFADEKKSEVEILLDRLCLLKSPLYKFLPCIVDSFKTIKDRAQREHDIKFFLSLLLAYPFPGQYSDITLEDIIKDLRESNDLLEQSYLRGSKYERVRYIIELIVNTPELYFLLKKKAEM